jgi:Zn-dependent peptidase ImmA (M78 family)
MTNTNHKIQETSILKSLRSLMPMRVLTYAETLQRADLQASRLLTLHQVTHAPVPVEIVTELPRLRVEQVYDLPVSGSAHWDGGSWVLTINAAEYDLRQRFSVMHEFKHVLDHPTRHLIQGDRRAKLTTEQMAEKVADYFAACVLMPKAWVKHAFCNERVQNVEALAKRFQVSPKAMSFRLSQLGLTVPMDRCAVPLTRSTGTSDTGRSSVTRTGRSSWPSQRSTRPTRPRYQRALSTSHRVLEGASS